LDRLTKAAEKTGVTVERIVAELAEVAKTLSDAAFKPPKPS
jgi:hypothetical protein